MSKLSPTRINLLETDQRWFYDKYPEENMSYLVRWFFHEFREFAESKEGTLEVHLREIHEKLTGESS
jgi:hypothetical protein